jgi:predicted CopG family antitoxin
VTTKTIGIKKEVYERLASEKRDDESFSDTVERLVDEAQSDWRRSFGKLEEDGDELGRVVEEQRKDLSDAASERQEERLDEVS